MEKKRLAPHIAAGHIAAGYTLVEMIIVIVIIGVLFLAFRNIFQMRNRDTLYGEACINNLYGEVSNFMYAAMTSKGLYSGTTMIYPDQYIIRLYANTNNKSIEFKYKIGNTPYTYKQFGLGTGSAYDMPKNFNCQTNQYAILPSTPSSLPYKITINKGFSEDNNLQSFYIQENGAGDTLFTGAYTFFLKSFSENTGKEIGKFEFDTRTQSIKSKTCLTINNTGTCNQRNQ